MTHIIHLAVASTSSQPGQLENNLNQIMCFERRAADGAQLLLTPEMSATGYGNYPQLLALSKTAGDGLIYRALSKVARETGVVICAGFIEQNSPQKHSGW